MKDERLSALLPAFILSLFTSYLRYVLTIPMIFIVGFPIFAIFALVLVAVGNAIDINAVISPILYALSVPDGQFYFHTTDIQFFIVAYLFLSFLFMVFCEVLKVSSKVFLKKSISLDVGYKRSALYLSSATILGWVYFYLIAVVYNGDYWSIVVSIVLCVLSLLYISFYLCMLYGISKIEASLIASRRDNGSNV